MYLTLLLIFNHLLLSYAFGQSYFPELTFRSITTKDGLTSNEVSGFAQGNDGQMWIGTDNGLNSYDGNSITNYYQKTDSRINLMSNYIYCMAKDKNNHLWISDRNSLISISLNDYKTTRFKQFQEIHHINPENNGIVFSSITGVSRINREKVTDIQIQFNTYQWTDKTIDNYINLYVDQNGVFFLTSQNRIHRISTQFKEDKSYIIPNDQYATHLYFDAQNQGWVSTWSDGLYVLDQKKDALSQVLKPEHRHAIIGDIKEWCIGKHNFIVASYSYSNKNGIILIDKSNMDYKIYDLKSYVNVLYVDNAGNLWAGTQNGIFIAGYQNGIIGSIPVITTNLSSSPGSSSVYTIYETKDHFWLTKRYGHGIFKYSKKWQLIKEFGPFKVENVNNYPVIADGFDFKLVGNKMYSTNELGIFVIDNHTNERKHIFTSERAEVKLRTIIPINDSTWFIRSYNKGIYVFNPTTNSFKKKYQIGDINHQLKINYLYKTSGNTILASTSSGLYRFDPKPDKFIRIDKPAINEMGIFAISEDQKHNLWLCTSKGIMHYNIDKNVILSDFSEYNDMGFAYRSAVDRDDNVWFTNANGYWCWNQKKQKMLKLNYNSGLVSDVEEPCAYIGTDDMVYLGGTDVVYKIDPREITKNTETSTVIISKILVNDEVQIPDFTANKYELVLPPGRSSVQIEFSVPDFSIQQSHNYLFKFSGADNWSDTKDGKIFIPDLTNGSYQILLKGISNFSGAESALQTVDITILPYWYQTLWFRFLLSTVILTALYLIYKRKLASENEKAKIRAEYEHKMIHLEMQNLRSQMNPHFIFNALNSINGFIVENKTHLASDYLTKFSKLIRMILDHSKNELVSLSKELDALNLYVMMEKNRFDQSFDFQIITDHQIDPDNIELPPLILQPYVENAIWHGLMHEKKTGQILIYISQSNDRIIFIIEDNGIGRQRANELKSKQNIKTTSHGMNITLARIKDHHASNTVVVTDILNDKGRISGTKVIISLKIK